MANIAFPTLRQSFLLDPNVIYLNHGSFGATPLPVFESYQKWQRELENQPCVYFRKTRDLLENSRASLANFLGTSSGNLAYVTNATTGINIAVHSLNLQPGDEVLSTNHEYGSCNRTWQYYSRKQGFIYINKPIPLPVTSKADFVNLLWEDVTSRTRVIYLSHITSPTALIFPVQEICQKARENGIITIIDGAHAPGQLPLNLDQLGADFYTGNLHKWLCAPKGAGFIYVRPEFQHTIEPLVVSWGWDPNYSGTAPLVDFIEQQGTRDLASFLSVPDAIQFFEENHWTEVRAYCHNLLTETIGSISQMFHMQPTSDLSGNWVSQMGCTPIPSHVDCADLHRRLYDEYSIEIPVVNWNNHKMLRISIQGYNTTDDTQTLINALRELI